MIFPFLRRIAYTSRKLAIIGNGFDLAHGLKTSYYDFVCAQKEGTFKNYKIKTIIVLGHSLFSDKQYLEALLNECVNLRKVIIFTYDGENENSIQRKKAFFQRFCRKVITCSY